ncbi:MAG: hypothetical protein IPO72_11730 [Saprospiraceae bacterium]|nr:hypothetical protein [Candidatus Vicinibacter affinis]
MYAPYKSWNQGMPIGIIFLGFMTSWAAVLTASQSQYRQKTIAAARIIPLNPNSPKVPVLSGM